MGIKGLSKLLQEHAPSCIKEQNIKSYFNRKIAIDASMVIYQFLISVRQGSEQLTNEAGEVTSHLTGMFYRTIKLMESGVKPIYVFDGKPPEFKSGELEKRRALAKTAREELAKAEDAGDTEKIEKFAKRTVRASKQHTEDCKTLLKLMGVPVVQATSEAEATAAWMTKADLAFGVGTEDMDAMTFGCTHQVRHLHKSEAQKMPILEFNLDLALQELELTMDQFIDMCILCGCDYIDTIRGIGPKRAYEGIKKYKTIEAFVKSLDKTKYPAPENFDYVRCRELFKSPDVNDMEEVKAQLKWTAPDEAGLMKFMCEDKGFAPERVQSGIKRIHKSKGQSKQGRLDSFFKVTTTINPKRKKEALAAKKAAAKKKKKTGGGFRGGRR